LSFYHPRIGTLSETEWLTGQTFNNLLDFVLAQASPRKLKLLVCALLRAPRVWCCIGKPGRDAVNVVERFVDGGAQESELRAARVLLEQTSLRHPKDQKEDAPWHVASLCQTREERNAVYTNPNAGYCGAYPTEEEQLGNLARMTRRMVEQIEERPVGSDLLRDLFANPRHFVSVNDAWLQWSGGLVPNLAQTVYEERAFDRLPALGDALKQAGCTKEEILAHCRSAGEHVRGCWVIDLLIGKE
jgi:hypothetical protein